MTPRSQSDAETTIRAMAREHRVFHSRTSTDDLAHHMSRLAGDVIHLDEVEQLLLALTRAGHLSRSEAVRLQARYLREARP